MGNFAKYLHTIHVFSISYLFWLVYTSVFVVVVLARISNTYSWHLLTINYFAYSTINQDVHIIRILDFG